MSVKFLENLLDLHSFIRKALIKLFTKISSSLVRNYLNLSILDAFWFISADSGTIGRLRWNQIRARSSFKYLTGILCYFLDI